jgi:pilus assembly protein FimV
MRFTPRVRGAGRTTPARPTGLRAHLGAAGNALALPLALSLLLLSGEAHALALGRVTVQSALGEPLRAEVEVAQITAEEASTLRAAPAPDEAFRAAGLQRHPALSEMRVSAERLADGRFVLRLASDRVINEPVIDLLLEASWSAGRIVRDYTLLFDPPVTRPEASAPAPVTAAQLPPTAATAAPVPGPSAGGQIPAATPLPPTAATTTTAPAAAPDPAPAPAQPPTERVNVRPGDTAARIVAAAKPPTVSLEQMLVALLQANPDAFVGNNMNRLRAGAVLELPAAETAAALEPQQARQIVRAQSQDFNEFKRRLAERAATGAAAPATAPPAGASGPTRQATGRVEARVEERKPTEPPAADRLTLSQGAVQGRPGASVAAPASAPGSEDRIARQRAEQDAANRLAELNRNMADLNRLSAAAGAGTASAPASGVPMALPGVAAASRAASQAASGASAVASDAAAASAALPASAPADSQASAASDPAQPASGAAAETAAVAASGASAPAAAGTSALAPLARLTELATQQPWPLALGTALVAGLGTIGGMLWWYRRRRAAAPAAPTSGMDSRLQDLPEDDEELPGNSGRLERRSEVGSRSSLLYSPSQLDASGEPDPVAEADVYLAYGRDLQAEEILQEALRNSPDRVAVMVKLLEICARRFDWAAFEPLARRVQALTGGRGPDWTRVAELGRGLAPVGHPLFNGDAPAPGTGPLPGAGDGAGPDGLALDLDGFRMPAPPAQPARAPAYDPEIDGPLSPDDDLTLAPPEAEASQARPPRGQAPAGAPLEFDLAGLSLDLGQPAADAGNPLETKLALAEEFRSIGDTEGARSLAEEVRAEATGTLRERAERLLSELG